MAKKIRNIGIILRPTASKELKELSVNIINWLLKKNLKVFLPEIDRKALSKYIPQMEKKLSISNLNDIHKQTELIISVGGDGTLIGVARKAHRDSASILGLKMGGMGFITEFVKSNIYQDLQDILKGKYEFYKLHLYKAELIRDNKVINKAFFINDAVINRAVKSRLFTLKVFSGDTHIYDLAGDGLIVSSPIGSTAYSLAAGGPIIHPDVNSMALTPICPHSLTNRPLVIPDNMTLTIKPSKKDEIPLRLTIDGQEEFIVHLNDEIRVNKVKNRYAKIITNPKRDYFNTLKEKFTYGKR